MMSGYTVSADLVTTTFGPLDKYVAANDNKEGGWTSWPGGACPVSLSTTVEVRLRNGSMNERHASDFDWEHGGGPYGYENDDDIIAFREAFSREGWGGVIDDPKADDDLTPEQIEAEGGYRYRADTAPFEERAGDFIQVYSGRKFWPMDPRADEVHIEDIAHALSLQCRYAGHCIKFYSVAEHSVLMARWLLRHYGPFTALYGLLHDASEAYLVDVPRPVKPYLVGYKDAEERVQNAVHDRFGLGRGMPAPVKEADDRIIADELVNLRPMEWHARFDKPLGVDIACWMPEFAEDMFLETFVMLQGRLGLTTGRVAA